LFPRALTSKSLLLGFTGRQLSGRFTHSVLAISGGDNNIFTQIGFVVLIGLASKNANFIVEFAKLIEEGDGKT
jgi:multidrug efflux pump subunit AcrB